MAYQFWFFYSEWDRNLALTIRDQPWRSGL